MGKITPKLAQIGKMDQKRAQNKKAKNAQSPLEGHGAPIVFNKPYGRKSYKESQKRGKYEHNY